MNRYRKILFVALCAVVAVAAVLAKLLRTDAQGKAKITLVLRDETARMANALLATYGSTLDTPSVVHASEFALKGIWPVEYVSLFSRTPQFRGTLEASGWMAVSEEMTLRPLPQLGDYVLICDGIDLRNVDPRIWVVVHSLNAGHNEQRWPRGIVSAGTASGIVIQFPVEDLEAQMRTQNAIRQQLHLESLIYDGSLY